MRPSSPMIVAVFAAGFLAALAWWLCDRPVAVSESWSGPVESVSFAPYRRYQDPLSDYIPSKEQIEEDLKSLAGHAAAVRTYSVRDGLDVVPEVAQKLGIKVTLGAWLNSAKKPEDAVKNEQEISLLIDVANKYPDTVTRVIVGNEVMLRRDLTADELVSYINRVKAAIKQPVSTADVWAFYLKNPSVAQAVDYLTIHILPFWEDQPVAMDKVADYVPAIVDRIRTAFPGKPILIGETGWPSIGRDRGPAAVSLANEARYVREIATLADHDHFDYNIVEAFDQPWKAELENTVGAYWGILDADRRPKFAMSGPVTETPDWPLRAAISLLLGAGAALWFGRGVRRPAEMLALAVLAQLCAWAVVTGFFHSAAVSFRWWQFIWQPLRAGMPAILALAVVAQAGRLFGASRQTAESRLRDPWHGEALTLGFAAYALIWSFLLFIDGRYRDIPELDFCLPAVAIPALIVLRMALGGGLSLRGMFPSCVADGPKRSALVAVLGAGLLAGALFALASEGVAIIGEDFTHDHPTLAEQIPLILTATYSNREMNLWVFMQLVMSMPFLAEWWGRKGRLGG